MYRLLQWLPGQDVCPRWVSARGGCLGSVCPLGCVPGDVSQHALRQKPPHPTVNRMTDRCKNITFPQLHCGRQKNSVNEPLDHATNHYYRMLNVKRMLLALDSLTYGFECKRSHLSELTLINHTSYTDAVSGSFPFLGYWLFNVFKPRPFYVSVIPLKSGNATWSMQTVLTLIGLTLKLCLQFPWQ